jgi:hypothetical protein
MRLIIFLLLVVLNVSVKAQGKYILPTELFEWKAGVEHLDTVHNFSVWQSHKTTYENGRKHEEIRVFITEGCTKNDAPECNIKFQHQKYYDDSTSTLMMKEGKYLVQKKDKYVYKTYYWDYNSKGKLMSKSREKENMD